MANKNRRNRSATKQKSIKLNEDRKENLKITDSDSKRDSTNLSKSGKDSTEETIDDYRGIQYFNNETFRVTNENENLSVQPVNEFLHKEETPKELKTKESDEQEEEISSLNSSYATAFDEWECSSQLTQLNEMRNEIEEELSCECNVDIENLRTDLKTKTKFLELYESEFKEKEGRIEKLLLEISKLKQKESESLSRAATVKAIAERKKEACQKVDVKAKGLEKKVKELEEKENRLQQKIQKFQNERTEKQNVFDKKLAEKGKENRKLQEENSRLSVQVKEKEATIKSLRSKTKVISDSVTEKASEKSEDFRLQFEKLQKMRDNLKNGFYLKEEKKKTERLLSARDNSNNRKMVDSELKRLEREFEKYLQDVEKNMKQIEKTRNIDNIPSLSKMPRLSKKFMNEYNELNIQDEPSTSSDSHEESLNDECIICHEDMTTDSEILKCEVCTTRYHLNCASPWLKLKSQCPTCDRILLDPNEFPSLS